VLRLIYDTPVYLKVAYKISSLLGFYNKAIHQHKFKCKAHLPPCEPIYIQIKFQTKAFIIFLPNVCIRTKYLHWNTKTRQKVKNEYAF